MSSSRFRITWKTILLPVAGILAFLIYFYIFNVDIPKMIAVAQRTNLSIYSLAVIAVLVETFFFALSWRSLLSLLSVKLSILQSNLYTWFGFFMDILIPAESISGEISRVYLVKREHNETGGKTVASLVAQRLIAMGINLVSLIVSTVILLMGGQLGGIVLNITLFLVAAISILLVLLILLCVKEKWTLKIVKAVMGFIEYIGRGRWKLKKVREEVLDAAKTFHDSMREFGRAPMTLFISLFFHILSWVFSIGVSYLVFLSMGYSIHWGVIVITTSIVAGVKAIPIGIPFEAGLPEITMSTLYKALLPEISFDVCATVTILIRLLTVWLRFFIGFAAQQWLGIKAITSKDNSISVQPAKT